MRALLLLSLLLSCAPLAPECESACGMAMTGSEDCEGFRHAEHNVLEAFAPLYAPHEACLAVADVDVSVFPAASMPRVRGLTQGDSVLISDESVGQLGWSYGLAHEVGGHVLDRRLGGVSDADHSTWDERGVWAAIERARDLSGPPVLTGSTGGSH